MAGQLRAYRRQIRSVQATKKITRAMELIAASRIIKAQANVRASTPYARALTRAVSAAASNASLDHPLITEKPQVRRAAVLLLSSDRGLAGAYSSSVLREGERLTAALRAEGKEVSPYLVGRKAASFYRFRRRDVTAEWAGFTDSPRYEHAKEIGERLVADFGREAAEGGVDEIHVVYTHFVSMVTQEPRVIRLLPLEVVEGAGEQDGELMPLYSFEPSPEAVLDALLPQYVNSRVYNCLLQAAASELAARQRAMKSATDNADELIKSLTRLANNARQADITQEITEIVGGADALSSAGSRA
ncbi:F0F1 ATP synthase subunit gamma [Paenibacillus sp. TRM 82003]|uniref:F0F1 ATP synthase subunit gamma n=1 Tax=Kineococcus sp. TRM81007 TaxID=2925831 RepID=UPI001F584238|nr:F0F1 ATP synthase subunit gamma [Kineococcus sp. TRM81007]MCI2239307.1 F0F1 ATP synthase subunit gamma [Kineococcus sp. TRM81007]MCI3924991.1 F0F1 ATP synthase subunit gamma [Paenibacillus sp. TRM 82003]